MKMMKCSHNNADTGFKNKTGCREEAKFISGTQKNMRFLPADLSDVIFKQNKCHH